MIDNPGTALLIVLAGLFAGAINAVVGSGTLVTYSALLAAGLPPVTANGTNTAGLSPGGFASAYAYRAELRDRIGELSRPMVATVVGSVVGAGLVVVLPEEIFVGVIPWLIALATVLVAVQPLRNRAMRRWAPRSVGHRPSPSVVDDRGRRRLWPWTGAVGIYGGYFGAAQGVIYMAILTWRYDDSPQNSNAAKNLLAACSSTVAAVVFISFGAIVWSAALLLAVSSIVGGYLGGRWARRLPPMVLRGMVIAVGIIATTTLLID